MYTDISTFCVNAGCTIQDSIKQMNENRLGIILVVAENKHLVGTVTDGDIRRAILAQIELSNPIQLLLDKKEGTLYFKPLSALVGQSRDVYLRLLKEHSVLHLPLLDKENRVVGLATMDEFVEEPKLGLQAVVMAGGRGSRLYPLTESMPKPMLPVGDKPLLEIIIERLKQSGVRRINVTTHHKPGKIAEYFGNGEDFGVEMQYVAETEPLGTAGALGLMTPPQETLLVINGDILTDVDFRAMMAFHREHKADFTVAVRQYDFQVPYGVLECEGEMVKCLQEKPVCKFLVNAGIYLLEPGVFQYIQKDKQQDMTDLIQTLLENGKSVVSFPIHEEWLDIGGHVEYQQAQQQAEKFITQD